MLEENISQQSYEEGLEIGKKEGNIEAYHFGYHKGAEIGGELGYYYSIVNGFLEKETNDKARNLLNEIKQEIDEFPKENDTEKDLLKILEGVRVKFKKLCTILKISSKLPKANEQLSF